MQIKQFLSHKFDLKWRRILVKKRPKAWIQPSTQMSLLAIEICDLSEGKTFDNIVGIEREVKKEQKRGKE